MTHIVPENIHPLVQTVCRAVRLKRERVRPARRNILLLTAACLLTAPVAAQSPPTAAVPLPVYDLRVALDLVEPRMAVTARIVLPAANEARSSVSFALSELFPDAHVDLATRSMHFDSLRIEKTNRSYSRPGWGTNTWAITPRQPIPGGEPVTLVVSYTGAGDLKSFVFSLGASAAFAAGQNSAWYPEIEEAMPHPAGRLRGLRGTGRLTLDIDSGIIAYSAGRMTTLRGEGRRRTMRFDVTKPMYFSFAAGPFITTNGTYYLKRRSSAHSDGARAREVLRVMEEEFGPHPFGQFAVVEVPASDADRAGFAGASADGFIMASSEFLDKPFNTAYYGHEIAHQWWGVTVRPTGPRGVWMLSEAMAQYGSLRAVEKIDGRRAAERYRRDEYPGYLGLGGKSYFALAAAGHDAPLADLPLDGEWSRPLANSKGFMAWNALSLEIGRERFRRILADIVRRHSTTRMTWAAFLDEVSTRAGQDLSWFFTEWFDRSGVPEWSVISERSHASSAMKIHSLVPYRASVRVDIASAHCARVSKVLLLRNEYTDVPTVPTRCGPTSIVVDPMYEIIHWTPELRRAFATPPSQ